jgi:hypothetical protein
MTRPAAFSERISSPDGRYYLLTAMNEVAMSHWIRSASLWDAIANDPIVSIGDGSWSSDEIAWSADGQRAFIDIQRYPGDAPAAALELNVETGQAIIRTHEGEQTVAFEQLSAALDGYYERNHHEEPLDEEPPLFASGAIVATTLVALLLWFAAGLHNVFVVFGGALLAGVPGGYLLERLLRR